MPLIVPFLGHPRVLLLTSAVMVVASGSTFFLSARPSPISSADATDMANNLPLAAEERSSQSSFDEESFLQQMNAVRQLQASASSARSVTASFGSTSLTDPLLNHGPSSRSGHPAPFTYIPAVCVGGDLSFLKIFDGALTCGDKGYVFPLLYNGDCPVSACILQYGEIKNGFGGPLNF